MSSALCSMAALNRSKTLGPDLNTTQCCPSRIRMGIRCGEYERIIYGLAGWRTHMHPKINARLRCLSLYYSAHTHKDGGVEPEPSLGPKTHIHLQKLASPPRAHLSFGGRETIYDSGTSSVPFKVWPRGGAAQNLNVAKGVLTIDNVGAKQKQTRCVTVLQQIQCYGIGTVTGGESLGGHVKPNRTQSQLAVIPGGAAKAEKVIA